MKTILLVAVIAFPILLSGQSAKANPEPPFNAHGAFFALSVADLDASAKWYSDKIGLKVIMQVPKTKDVDFAVIVLGGGGLLVELLHSDSARSLSKAASAIKDPFYVHGIVKAGLIVDKFDKTLEMLRARNVSIKMGPFPAHNPTGLKNVIIEDNSGNLIQIYGQ